jgi:hypothetical protein
MLYHLEDGLFIYNMKEKHQITDHITKNYER